MKQDSERKAEMRPSATESCRCYIQYAVKPAIAILALLACRPSGDYGGGSFASTTPDRGETNGRMFDFVTDKPFGDDWQIRVRGDALWASYAQEAKTDQLGTKTLTAKQAETLWGLIDNLDMTARSAGQQDEDNGTVTLRLREPGADKHGLYTVYVSRATEDEDVLALGIYLRTLVAKHFGETPNF